MQVAQFPTNSIRIRCTGRFHPPCEFRSLQEYGKKEAAHKGEEGIRGEYSTSYNAHPTVTSKMLLPTELDTAMSPNPFRATITLVIRSGMLVPAARNVRPITSGGMRTVSPATFAHQTIRYE